MKRLDLILALTFGTAFAGAWPSYASNAKVTLLREAEVRGDSIYLSDLLPTGAPSGVRDYAQKVVIGAAPQLGSTRVLTASAIENLVREQVVLGNLEVPQQIVVHRTGRPVTKEEVLVAIRKALDSNGFSAAIDTDDIHLQAPVMVSAADPELQVTRMDFDSPLKESRFLLMSRSDRSILPFVVLAHLREGISKAPAPVAYPSASTVAVAESRSESHPIVEANPAPAPVQAPLPVSEMRLSSTGRPGQIVARGNVLVQPGQLAELRVQSGTMRMMLEVKPLERGVMGQKVRVKLPTGKVLQGQVVGEGRLEAAF